MKEPTFQFHNNLMLLCMLTCGILLSVYSERIFQNDGLGFDGANYGIIILRDDDSASGVAPVSDAMYLRHLPALAIRSAMQILGMPRNIPNIIMVFQSWNLFMLCFAAFAWGRACDATGIRSRGKWFGFCGLFLNYAVLKYTFYYPVLLDTTGLALGIILAWLYLIRRPWWTLAVGGLGCIFCPPVGLEGLLLFAFPRPSSMLVASKPTRLLPITVASILAGSTLFRFLSIGPINIFPGMEPYHLLADAVTVSYVWLSTYYMCNGAYNFPNPFRDPHKYISPRLVFVAFLICLAIFVPIIYPKLAHLNAFTLFKGYVIAVLNNSVGRPGEFLVAHTLYFGPVILLAIYLFPAFSAAVRSLGGGMVLVVAFALFQFLNPLSRQMIGALPFLILPLCLVVESRPLPISMLWVFAAASLTVSKVWMIVNAGADTSIAMNAQPEVWRRYLSSTGNWMETPDYAIQGMLVAASFLGLGGFLYWLRRNGRIKHPEWSQVPDDQDR